MLEIHLIINRCHQLQDICRDLFLWGREKELQKEVNRPPDLICVGVGASTSFERNIVFAYLCFAASVLVVACGIFSLHCKGFSLVYRLSSCNSKA